jgi:uncharacterized membrane protein (DUF4010 family)
METYTLFLRFGAALGIGVLVGLQREYAELTDDDPHDEMFAGARTFALLGLAGCAGALAADVLGSAWAFIGLALVVGGLIGVAYFVTAWRRQEIGLTTEIAALVTLLTGALCYWNQLALAVALGVTVTVLLAIKVQVRSFVRLISPEDIYATLRFAVITAIVLPVLPNQTFGPPPLNVLNPYKIWQMVVLISAINFLGYLLIKLVGPRRGIGLTGVLGGVASSTAVTLSFAQRSREKPALARAFALAVIVAWTMMFPRVLLEVAVVNRSLLMQLWPPIVGAGLVGLLYSGYLYMAPHADEGEDVAFSNPFALGPAVKFGLLYAGVLLVSRSAEMTLGNTGVYLSSVAAGLADVDAITLSVAELSRVAGGLDLVVAERAIVLAAMANTAVKGGIVLATGSRSLRRALWPAFLLILVTGISLAFLL